MDSTGFLVTVGPFEIYKCETPPILRRPSGASFPEPISPYHARSKHFGGENLEVVDKKGNIVLKKLRTAFRVKQNRRSSELRVLL